MGFLKSNQREQARIDTTSRECLDAAGYSSDADAKDGAVRDLQRRQRDGSKMAGDGEPIRSSNNQRMAEERARQQADACRAEAEDKAEKAIEGTAIIITQQRRSRKMVEGNVIPAPTDELSKSVDQYQLTKDKPLPLTAQNTSKPVDLAAKEPQIGG